MAEESHVNQKSINTCSHAADDLNVNENVEEIPIPQEKTVLKRNLGLFSGVSFIMGVIIGTGIFVSPKGILLYSESIGLCLIIWAASGLIALLGALCYAEIGVVIPLSGAELPYLREGIGSVHKRLGDVLAFIFNWSTIFILQPAAIAILALTFSQYLLSGIMTDQNLSGELMRIIAIAALLILIFVNSVSVQAANRLNIVFLICKILTILTIIIVGLVRLAQGHTQNLQNTFVGTTTKPLEIALAFYSGLWAYDGWNSLNTMTEELKNPKRNLWLAIVLAVPSVIILYVLTNISYFTVMDKRALLDSDAVAITWAKTAFNSIVHVLPILIAISALGSCNASLFTSGRYCMTGARYGYLPEVFACIQRQRLTPLPGIVFQGILSMIFCIPSNIQTLIEFFSFVAWIFYGLTFVATLCCKFTKAKANRVISVPIPLIILIILISIYLIVAPVISNPNIGFLIAASFILFGLVFYYPFVYRKIELKIIQKINAFLIRILRLEKSGIDINN